MSRHPQPSQGRLQPTLDTPPPRVAPQGLAPTLLDLEADALEAAFRSALLKLQFIDNLLDPLPPGDGGATRTDPPTQSADASALVLGRWHRLRAQQQAF